MVRFYCSGSVEPFREKIKNVWKLEDYEPERKQEGTVVFFGLYQMQDLESFRSFRGKKIAFWCGSDLMNFIKVPELQAIVKQCPDAIHYVENQLEHDELKSVGIESEIRPSFLEDIDKFPVSFKPTNKPHVYLSSHVNREDEYGLELIKIISLKLPHMTFHIYGIDKENEKNIIFHGRVSPEQFNKEIKDYHCGLRPNDHDGNSEIAMKSVLMGQYPITKLEYPHIWNYKNEDELIQVLKRLTKKRKPNLEARKYWRKNVNDYPWMK